MRRRHLTVAAGIILASLLAVAVLSAGCGNPVVTIEKGRLLIGSDTKYPPFEYMEGGKPVGFDVDIADAIAGKMKLELKVISAPWTDLIKQLKSNRFDVIVSAMTITPERKTEINFSDPYIDADQSICVAKGSSIRSAADLSGKVVGVQRDSTGQFTAERTKGIKEIKKYDSILQAFTNLAAGGVDAVINDYPVNAYTSEKTGKTEVVAIIKTNEKYGIGVKKSNTELLKKINQALIDLKSDGTYDTIYKKWFGKKA